MTYSRGLDRQAAEMIERSARKLAGWSVTLEERKDGNWNVRLEQPALKREAIIVGPGGFDDFLDANGHHNGCRCAACEQWWADTCAEQDRRYFGEQGARP